MASAEPTYGTEPVSLAAYTRLREPDGTAITEVVRGRLVREPRPGYRHARIQAHLAWLLRAWVERAGEGVVLTDVGIVLSEEPATVRGPDVAFVGRDRRPENDLPGLLRTAPDLVAEIASPGDSASDLLSRVLDYLDAGVREVWLVDPDSQTVTVYRSRRDVSVLEKGDVLTGGDVLPGLQLPVRAVFER